MRMSRAKDLLNEVLAGDLSTSEMIEASKALAFIEIADELYNLGMRDAATPMGAIESLGAVIKEAANEIATSMPG